MGTKPEPNAIVEKSKYWNNIDEAYGFLCLSISKDLLFHLSRLKTPKEVWEQLVKLFGKQDYMRAYQLKNELISLNLGNFDNIK